MVPTIDTNILVYSVDDRDPIKQSLARSIVVAVHAANGSLALQSCGEFCRAATSRLGKPPHASAQVARNWLNSFPVFPASSASMDRALGEAATGRLSFWDANLLSAAEMAGCTHMISEDMSDGFRLGRLEVLRAFDGDRVASRVRQMLQI